MYFVDEAVRLGPTFVDCGDRCFCKDPDSYLIHEAIFVKAKLSYFLSNLNDLGVKQDFSDPSFAIRILMFDNFVLKGMVLKPLKFFFRPRD